MGMGKMIHAFKARIFKIFLRNKINILPGVFRRCIS